MEIGCDSCAKPAERTLNCFHSFCENCLGNPAYGTAEVLHKCLVCGLATRVEENGIQNLVSGNYQHTCKDHSLNPFSFYCSTCQRLICAKCTTSGHKNHKHNPCPRVLPDHKEEVKHITERISRNIAAVSQAAAQQKALMSESENNVAVAQASISNTTEVLHSILEVRKDALLYQLQDASEEITKDLKTSFNGLTCLLASLNSFLSCVEKNFAICSEVEILAMRTSIEKYSSYLQSAYENLMDNRVMENEFLVRAVFQPSNMSEVLSTFGKIEISEKEEDLYEVQPWFTNPTLSLKLSVNRLRTPLHIFMNLKTPCGIALNHNGEILVAESRADKISLLSPISGESVFCFGQCGSDEGELRFPCSIAVDDKGNILVVDGCNNRIQKYSPRGKFLAQAGCYGKGQLQFREPEGIAVNPVNKKIYVVDNNCHRIQVLNEDLSFSFSFGSKGIQLGQLYYPWGIACTSNGDVYITDSGSCYVKVFTSSGKFIKEFGGEGDVEGCLKWPTGICLGQNGAVYVSEYGNHRVSIFTAEGKFLRCFGGKGVSENEFGNLRGLTIDSNGVLYICDPDNNRVLLY